MKKYLILFITMFLMIGLTSCAKSKKITLSYDESKIEVYVGDEISVKPNVELGKKVKEYELEYKLSSNIATVDKEGKLVAIEAGKTTLTVVANDKDKSSVELEIKILDKEYETKLDPNGGKVESKTISYKNDEVVKLPVPTKEGYTFVGWYEEDTLVEEVSGQDYNLIAKWTKNYVLTLDVNEGKMEEKTVYEFTDSKEITLPVPTKEGYTFVGWYEGEVKVEVIENRNYTLVAKWEINKYTVSLDVQGGALENNVITFEHDNIPTLPVPTKTNNKFLGWYENDVLVEVLENRDYTLVAKWEALPVYKISYSAKGAKMPSNFVKEFTNGEEVELPIPTKEGYNFIGWYENDVLVEVLENRDYKLVAKFEEIDDGIYSINYRFTEGSWYVKTISTRAHILEELYSDLYKWAKGNGETRTFEEYQEEVLTKLENGEDIKLVSPTLLDKEATKGSTEYFVNTSKYYNKWIDFFNKVREIVLKKNASEDIYKDATALATRLVQFIKWNTTGKNYFLSYVGTLCSSIHVTPDVIYEYTIGDSFDLIPLVHVLDLDFLGWYDNPELTGEPVTAILPTDKGDKVFYPKFEEEIMPEEVILNKIIDLQRFETYQLTWNFNPIETTDQRVEFVSSNKAVAKVDSETGLITAIKDGITTITMKVYADKAFNVSFELEVYSPGQVIGEYQTTSYVAINDVIVLDAKLHGRGVSTLVWESLDESIATVDSVGNVAGIKEGVVSVRAKDANNPEIYLDFIVTVVSQEVSDELQLLLDSHNANIFVRKKLGIGSGIPEYYKDIYGSVNKLLMNEALVIDDSRKDIEQNNKTGDYFGVMESIEFITVHYTGNMRDGADSDANADYFVGDNEVSIHFCTGNDGVDQCLPLNIGAYHAGDSGAMDVVGPFKWHPTGVKVSENDPLYPVFTISDDFYYEINGNKTSIEMPTPYDYKNRRTNHILNSDGTISSQPTYGSPFSNRTPESFINMHSLPFKIVDGEYYMGTTWWCYTQVSEGRICSTGGNRNSIGIESCVNRGSDLWYTWQITAQLVAKLMVDNKLDITRVRGHHFYTAKDCPQPMLENDMEIWWEFLALVEAEYELRTKFNGYTLTAVSNNPDYLRDNGRVRLQPDQDTCLSYTVTISNGEKAETITLGTMLSGKYTI